MAKRAQRPAPQSDASDPRVVTIRSGVDKTVLAEMPILRPERLERIAREWSYILRVRARWASDPDLRDTVGERACEALKDLGVPHERFADLAAGNQIEVEFHDWDPNDAQVSRIHEAAADVPWEYLISTATRTEGRLESLLITRLFRNGMSAVRPHPPANMLFVESAPGRIMGEFEFTDEEERIRVAVNATGNRKDRMFVLNTPELSELQKKAEQNWEAIHVTGVDTQQAAWLIEDFYETIEQDNPTLWQDITSSGRLRDGMILREGREIELPVPYDKLATALVGLKPAPRVVTLNLYYSGARIARELVRLGAHSALGFLDEIDDELAELFFQAFYWAWCHPAPKPISVPDAFLGAWQKLRGDKLHGTSIVVWMGRSVFDPPARPARASRRRKR